MEDLACPDCGKPPTVEILCDCLEEHSGHTEGDGDQVLVWYCPTEKKWHRDTNA